MTLSERELEFIRAQERIMAKKPEPQVAEAIKRYTFIQCNPYPVREVA